MLPFEFTVPGVPISHQSRNKAKLTAWRLFVRTVAAAKWGSRDVVTGPVKITVTYYHEGEEVRIDNDNMVKPIQDAMIGIIYSDDRFITDCVVRKTSIAGEFRIRGYSLVLLEALSKGEQFVHVIIDEAPSHHDPLR